MRSRMVPSLLYITRGGRGKGAEGPSAQRRAARRPEGGKVGKWEGGKVTNQSRDREGAWGRTAAHPSRERERAWGRGDNVIA